MRYLLSILLLCTLTLHAEDLYLLTASEKAGLQQAHDLYKAECAAKGKAWSTNTHHTIYLVPVVKGTNDLSVVTHWLKFPTQASTNGLGTTNLLLKTKAQVEATGINLGSITKLNQVILDGR